MSRTMSRPTTIVKCEVVGKNAAPRAPTKKLHLLSAHELFSQLLTRGRQWPPRRRRRGERRRGLRKRRRSVLIHCFCTIAYMISLIIGHIHTILTIKIHNFDTNSWAITLFLWPSLSLFIYFVAQFT